MPPSPLRRLALVAAVGGALLAPAVPAADGDWPLHGLDHANSRFSPLAALTPANVGQLVRRWTHRTGIAATFQATPIVVDGVMFVSTPFNDVIALDAASGEARWRYRHVLRTRDTCCGPANRGVAVSGGRVLMATIDGRMIALDATSGAPVWDVELVDTGQGTMEELAPLLGVPELAGARQTGQTGYSANMAPQVVDDLVLVGVTGAGYGLHVETEQDGRAVPSVAGLGGERLGLRGFVVALELATGAERWRWYSVPDEGWEGDLRARTAYGEPLGRDLAAERAALPRFAAAARFGGGSIWTTPAVDGSRGLVFLGTGNPAPQMDDATRPGDNLHTVSLVALDLASGELRWAYQQVPHDRWGYDVASPPVLLRMQHEGRLREVVGQASKTGWFFVHDRDTGELLLRSRPFAPQENLFTPPTAAGVRIAPSAFGACSWSPVAWSERDSRVYIAGGHVPAMYYSRELAGDTGLPWTSYTLLQPVPEAQHGLLTAVDLPGGELAWQVRTPRPLVGGVLATAGGLVFTGEGDGRLSAYEAATGARRWSDSTQAGVNAPPITYAVDGVQFVAVAAGGNSLYGYPVGDELIAYALPAEASDAVREGGTAP